jgi:hypothetical protein
VDAEQIMMETKKAAQGVLAVSSFFYFFFGIFVFYKN